MKITVFGATGGIGGHVVRQALAAGHQVTAVVRDRARVEVSDPALEVATVPDLTDPEPLRARSRAATSRSRGRPARAQGRPGRLEHHTRNAARDGGQRRRRFVAVSAVPVGPVPDGESFLNRRILLPLIGAVARDVYVDLAEMEDEIRGSATDGRSSDRQGS